MDPPASQPPTRKFSEKRKNLSTSRDHRPRISKRQKKLQSESESKTLIPKIHSKPKCSGKLVACQSSKQKKLKSERKQRETRGVYGGRRWTVSPKNSSVHKDRVVVVSYNILGVENALKLPELYHQVPPEFLDWNHRKKTICKEITYYHPSIVCFQEVDRFEELNYILQEDGFKGIYKGRTGEACDGCAIFWRHDLAPKERRLLVGNIHVLFNPKRGDIKLGQVRMFIEKAHQLSQTWGDIPIILSGDFNSQPKSAMYQFLSASELDIQLNDRRNISGQPGCSTQWRTAQSVQYNRNGFWKSISKPLLYDWSREELYSATGCEQITHLRHRLNISSAYAGIPGTLKTRDHYGEPLATSYHSQYMGTVDYIWHTEDLVPMKLLETLSLTELRATGGLPSKEWGSDHLALACEFAFLDKTAVRK